MSQENAEIMRTLFERFNRSGFVPEELWQPDGVLVNFRESPIPGPDRGHDGLLTWREDLFEVVEEGRFDVESLTDAVSRGMFRFPCEAATSASRSKRYSDPCPSFSL
jgi:hypothetical protein